MILKKHISPIESPSEGEKLKLEEINDANFNPVEGLRPDIIYRTGNWLVANKTKTWSLLDMMVVYCGRGIPLSFDDLRGGDLRKLFNICSACASIIKQSCPVVYIGANINHSFNPDSFLRLHLHVMGFTPGEISNQLVIEQKDFSSQKALITDPMVGKFNETLSEKFKAQKYDFGLTKQLEFGFDEIKGRRFCKMIKRIDAQIKNTFGGTAYSFCLKFENDKTTLNLVPRSIFGKGVLESDGIILERTREKKFTRKQLETKLAFVIKVRQTLERIFGTDADGKYINNLAKRVKGE
jgi:hypothetical protein